MIAEFARERRVFVPIDEVPPMVIDAFLSAEDKNFYTHPGVDATGIAKAIVRFAQAKVSGRAVRLSGASTITQQVVKNFLVGDERSIERKIREGIPGCEGRDGDVQGQDPGALPERHLSG